MEKSAFEIIEKLGDKTLVLFYKNRYLEHIQTTSKNDRVVFGTILMMVFFLDILNLTKKLL